MRHRNHGLRKRCVCNRKDWPKCSHSWYLNYKPKGGPQYRLSLDREAGRHIDGKTVAVEEAERIRIAIRNGTFRTAPARATAAAPVLTFKAFADMWKAQRVLSSSGRATTSTG